MPRVKKNPVSANAGGDVAVKKPARKRAAATKKPVDESESDEGDSQKAVKKQADKLNGKPKKPTKGATNKSEDDESDDEPKTSAKQDPKESEEDSDDEPKKAPVKRAARTKRAPKESEEDDSDDEPKKAPVKRAAPTKPAPKESEDDLDDEPKKAPVKRAARTKLAPKQSEDESDNDEPKKVPVKRAARTKRAPKESEDDSDDEAKKAPAKKAARTKPAPKLSEDESDDDEPKKAPVKRPARTKRAPKESEDDSDDGKPKKSAPKRAAPKGKDKASDGPKSKQKKSNPKPENAESEDKPKEKTIIIKGQAAVDPECEAKQDCAHVYCGDGNIYDAMLNQTNLRDNNNKYYLLQLLEDDDAATYSVWFRWGRVGKKGQCSLSVCGSDFNKAKNLFTKKFSEKTRNKWEDRDNFVKVPGKYDLLKMDYSTESVMKEEKEKPEKKVETVSQLEPRLQNLLELIFNIKAMEATVVEMKYDANKSPLGKLTTEQIKAGFTALKKIEDCVSKSDFGPKLVAACDEFYTRIPHDFGMKRPPVITTLEVVHAKVELLETLGDIEIAMKLLREEIKADEHPIDRHYKSLNCNLQPVDKSDPNFEMIEQYLQNTHGDTHTQYKLELVNLFECDRTTEKQNYKDVGNRMLLWHGSRLANYAGILKQGLRIAPPEAPVTGYMFDKGVYFADMSSKSANYCFTTSTNPLGLLLLCEVSLGTPKKLLSSDCNASKLPAGHHSVMGQGQVAPNPKDYKTLSDGTVVPFGKGASTGVTNPSGYTLQYNEYIVYDTKQVRLRYLLQTRFKYSR